MIEFPPGLILVFGAILVPILKGYFRLVWTLILPLFAFLVILSLPNGNLFTLNVFGQELQLMRVDQLSRLFSYVFLLASFIGGVYSFHLRESIQASASLIYGGATVGAVFCGDLISLFVFWEITAIASVFLILARKTDRARAAAIRYLIIQIGSGMFLFAGLIIRWHQTGSVDFGHIGLDTPGGLLIFLAFGIKCAFPLLHSWLVDAYPEATVTGTVILSIFTTKLAIYVLARGFAGTEELIWIGAIMAAFPIFYAILENDLRRVLSYSLINQLGFMVVAIGVGTEMALNGAAAHAFTHIIYKALLLMSVGALMYRTGTALGNQLGGLFKSMPLTAGFCVIGAASISAFPFFSGFISKAIILSAVAHEGYFVVWLVLLFASDGVLNYVGIKIHYYGFFDSQSEFKVSEAPINMLIAMALAAAFCIFIGLFPSVLYNLLPYPINYIPYTTSHILSQFLLLLFSAIAFIILLRKGIYPKQLNSTHLDVDWLYRKPGRDLIKYIYIMTSSFYNHLGSNLIDRFERFIYQLYRHHGPHGVLAKTWPTGSMVLWVAVLLVAYLFFYFI